MTTYTITVPCTITYVHNPEEKETRTEPSVDEEFYINSIRILGLGCTSAILEDHCGDFEEELYKYLKENKNEV